MTRTRLVVAMAMVLGLVTLARHDAGAAPVIALDDVDVSRHPQIAIELTVPGSGSLLPLPSSAFEVLENGRGRSATAERISLEDTEVVVVIDTSGSMSGEPMAAARRAASDFVGTLPPGTNVSVIGFGPTPTVALPFSGDLQAQRAAIDALAPAGETALYDALVAAAGLPASRPGARRAIVVLSDGGDTVSAAPLDAAVAALVKGGSDVSVVELATPESDRAALDRLATETGGRVLRADDPAALDAAYRGVTEALISRYRVAFTAAAGGDVDLVVRVRVGDQVLSAAANVRYPAPAPAPTATTTAAASVPSTIGGDPGLFGSRAALVTGAALVAAALAYIVHTIQTPRRRRVRLDAGSPSTGLPSVGALAQRATLFAERRLENARRGDAIDALLERAGLDLRAAEAVVATAGIALAAFLVGGLAAGPLLGVVLAVLVVAMFRPVLVALARRRERQFASQVDSLLQLLAGGLRAGYGLLQAIETAGQELESPAGDEIRRFTTEVRLGRDAVESLDALAARVRNEDFAWVAQAIRIHREVGGDLAEVLDRVSETIRARGRLHRQVRALSAEGRISAYILLALPFVLAAATTVLNPGYLDPLFDSGAGFALVGLGATLMSLGALWLRRLVRPVF